MQIQLFLPVPATWPPFAFRTRVLFTERVNDLVQPTTDEPSRSQHVPREMRRPRTVFDSRNQRILLRPDELRDRNPLLKRPP